MPRVTLPLCALLLLLTGPARAQAPAPRPTADDAVRFVDAAEKRLLALTVEASRAGWVQANFITQDTEALSALASERLIKATAELAKQAETFRGVAVPPETARTRP